MATHLFFAWIEVRGRWPGDPANRADRQFLSSRPLLRYRLAWAELARRLFRPAPWFETRRADAAIPELTALVNGHLLHAGWPDDQTVRLQIGVQEQEVGGLAHPLIRFYALDYQGEGFRVPALPSPVVQEMLRLIGYDTGQRVSTLWDRGEYSTVAATICFEMRLGDLSAHERFALLRSYRARLAVPETPAPEGALPCI